MSETLTDLLDDAQLSAIRRPVHEARGLPGKAYGESFYQLEQRELFPNTWCTIGTGAQIPNPGDALEIDLAGWPLLAVRDAAGEIACFYNICRHRGNKLVEGKMCGLKRLSCNWHGWTYGLDGQLLSTPELGGASIHDAQGFERSTLGLRKVRSARWLDYIVVNLNANAPELSEHLKPLDEFLSRWDLSNLRHSSSWESIYTGGWKVSIEGAIEDYHVPWGHAQVVKGLHSRSALIETAERCFAATTSTWQYKSGRAPTRYQNALLPCIPGPNTTDAPQSCIVNLFPIGLIGLMSDHMMLGQMTPVAWDRTALRFQYYFVGDAATDPQRADVRREITDGWTEIAEQDRDYVRNVHAMYQTRDAANIETRFSPHWEGAVLHFQRMVVDALS